MAENRGGAEFAPLGLLGEGCVVLCGVVMVEGFSRWMVDKQSGFFSSYGSGPVLEGRFASWLFSHAFLFFLILISLRRKAIDFPMLQSRNS